MDASSSGGNISSNKSSSSEVSCIIHVFESKFHVIARDDHEVVNGSSVKTKCVPNLVLENDLRSKSSALAQVGLIRR